MARWGILLLLVSHLAAQDKFSLFGQIWRVPAMQDWRISEDAGTQILQLLKGREPDPGPRRPQQFALMEMPLASKVLLEADVRPAKRSLMIVVAYQDPAHFDYVHFSTDAAGRQPVHNGVFHVFGGERVRISSSSGPAAFSAINKWFHIKVEWNGASGEIQGSVDGAPVPSLHAVDLSLGEGRVGIGSFDETGDFKNVIVQTSLPGAAHR